MDDGPAIPGPYLPSACIVVPAGRFGYFSMFKGGSLLWGATLEYAYLGTSSDHQILALSMAPASQSNSSSQWAYGEAAAAVFA